MNESQIDRVFHTLQNYCRSLQLEGNASLGDGYCEAVFDGYFCWPFTRAGQLAVQPCSNDLLKSIKTGIASRKCTENGTWFVPSNHSEPWSNLTECGPFFIETNSTEAPPILHHFYSQWLPVLKNISYFGYAISIVTLITALCILVSIQRLHCPRNKLHINLFVSFIMRCFMSILKDGLFVSGTALVYETEYINGEPKFIKDVNYSWVCKAIISIRWYFILSNFMLMLMEGMYLHSLMFFNLFSDNHSIRIYCLLGWGLPFFFIIPWIVLRTMYEDVLCWTQKENIYISLFIDLPIGITVVINFLLFLIMVLVLILKLNNACIQQRRFKYRKLLKATLILIPVFGVPYSFSLLMSLYIKKSHILEVIWLFLDQTFTAFQGLFAALVYCLLNTEVQIELKRKYSSIKDRTDKEFRRSRTISHTQQFIMQAKDDPPENYQEVENDKQNPEEIIITKGDHSCS
ncbi:parathyroid hormone/parathyroid hormone-related peptide receptor [Anoplophora glabripennis]|uniref:parathyroid hormone/parathyroid hormone-related peptide receptor n=1 Tax=Anoplophora glabripennis TaxID=217634 RepID=UPI0008746383|nr:parathyroid hormone/parathyroid hormone-related peptide receptor [Anoplophora glabripennis]